MPLTINHADLTPADEEHLCEMTFVTASQADFIVKMPPGHGLVKFRFASFADKRAREIVARLAK